MRTPREFFCVMARASGNQSLGVVFSSRVRGWFQTATALIPRCPWRPRHARSISPALRLTVFLAGFLVSSHSRECPASVCLRAHFSFVGQWRAARPPAFAACFGCERGANHFLARSRAVDFRDALCAFRATPSRPSRAAGSASRATHFLSRPGPRPFRPAACWS